MNMKTQIMKSFKKYCRRFIFWAFKERVKDFVYKIVIPDTEVFRMTYEELAKYKELKMVNELAREMLSQGFFEITECRNEMIPGREIHMRLYCLK